MKKVTLWLMKYQLKLAEKSAQKETNERVKKAKLHRVKVFKRTILFLDL